MLPNHAYPHVDVQIRAHTHTHTHTRTHRPHPDRFGEATVNIKGPGWRVSQPVTIGFYPVYLCARVCVCVCVCVFACLRMFGVYARVCVCVCVCVFVRDYKCVQHTHCNVNSLLVCVLGPFRSHFRDVESEDSMSTLYVQFNTTRSSAQGNCSAKSLAALQWR